MSIFYIIILSVGMVLGLLLALGGGEERLNYTGLGLFTVTSILLFVIQFIL